MRGNKRRIVIYTALIGKAYDKLESPVISNNEVDLVCFVNSDINSPSNQWKYVRLDISAFDNIRLSRYPKILPHKTIISQYDYSLYIDANLVIKHKYVFERILELIKEETPLALIKHPARDCAYQEAYNCIAGCKASWRDLFRQILFLKRHHYPEHNGLYEANVIFRKHNDERVIQLDELWWDTYCRYSKRDQLSLVYALWKLKMPVEYFLPQGFSTLDHYAFERHEHLPKEDSLSIKLKKRIVSLFINLAKKKLKS